MTARAKVAYQGVEGAYSHLACRDALPDHEPLPCYSFEDMQARGRSKELRQQLHSPGEVFPLQLVACSF